MKPSRLPVLFFLIACGGASSPSTTPSTAPSTTPSTGADDAARAELSRAEAQYATFDASHIDCTEVSVLEDFTQCLQEQVRSLSGSAMDTVEAYQRVLAQSETAEPAVAALAGQARTFARVVQAMNDVVFPEVYPAALVGEDVQLSDEAREDVREQVESSVRQILAAQSAPIACRAAVYDVLALRLAQSQQVNSTYSQESLRRLSAMSDPQISACVDEGRASDETLEAYTPGELNLQR